MGNVAHKSEFYIDDGRIGNREQGVTILQWVLVHLYNLIQVLADIYIHVSFTICLLISLNIIETKAHP